MNKYISRRAGGVFYRIVYISQFSPSTLVFICTLVYIKAASLAASLAALRVL
jgi:hypothetical protein